MSILLNKLDIAGNKNWYMCHDVRHSGSLMSKSRATFNDLSVFKHNDFVEYHLTEYVTLHNFNLKFGRRLGDGNFERVLGRELSRSWLNLGRTCTGRSRIWMTWECVSDIGKFISTIASSSLDLVCEVAIDVKCCFTRRFQQVALKALSDYPSEAWLETHWEWQNIKTLYRKYYRKSQCILYKDAYQESQ